jgi:hypothetical protein
MATSVHRRFLWGCVVGLLMVIAYRSGHGARTAQVSPVGGDAQDSDSGLAAAHHDASPPRATRRLNAKRRARWTAAPTRPSPRPHGVSHDDADNGAKPEHAVQRDADDARLERLAEARAKGEDAEPADEDADRHEDQDPGEEPDHEAEGD